MLGLCFSQFQALPSLSLAAPEHLTKNHVQGLRFAQQGENLTGARNLQIFNIRGLFPIQVHDGLSVDLSPLFLWSSVLHVGYCFAYHCYLPAILPLSIQFFTAIMRYTRVNPGILRTTHT